MKSINFMGRKLGVSDVFSFGKNNSKQQNDFKNKLELAEIKKEEKKAVNVVPTFDVSTGIMLPF